MSAGALQCRRIDLIEEGEQFGPAYKSRTNFSRNLVVCRNPGVADQHCPNVSLIAANCTTVRSHRFSVLFRLGDDRAIYRFFALRCFSGVILKVAPTQRSMSAGCDLKALTELCSTPMLSLREMRTPPFSGFVRLGRKGRRVVERTSESPKHIRNEWSKKELTQCFTCRTVV
jgi:hypothetical protein